MSFFSSHRNPGGLPHYTPPSFFDRRFFLLQEIKNKIVYPQGGETAQNEKKKYKSSFFNEKFTCFSKVLEHKFGIFLWVNAWKIKERNHNLGWGKILKRTNKPWILFQNEKCSWDSSQKTFWYSNWFHKRT